MPNLAVLIYHSRVDFLASVVAESFHAKHNKTPLQLLNRYYRKEQKVDQLLTLGAVARLGVRIAARPIWARAIERREDDFSFIPQHCVQALVSKDLGGGSRWIEELSRPRHYDHLQQLAADMGYLLARNFDMLMYVNEKFGWVYAGSAEASGPALLSPQAKELGYVLNEGARRLRNKVDGVLEQRVAAASARHRSAQHDDAEEAPEVLLSALVRSFVPVAPAEPELPASATAASVAPWLSMPLTAATGTNVGTAPALVAEPAESTDQGYFRDMLRERVSRTQRSIVEEASRPRRFTVAVPGAHDDADDSEG